MARNGSAETGGPAGHGRSREGDRAVEAKSKAERAKAEADKLKAEAAKAKAEAAQARAEADQAQPAGRSTSGSAPAVTGTPCQRLFASGASLDVVYMRWAEAGFPTSWDADKDGIPCEKSYGEQP